MLFSDFTRIVRKCNSAQGSAIAKVFASNLDKGFDQLVKEGKLIRNTDKTGPKYLAAEVTATTEVTV